MADPTRTSAAGAKSLTFEAVERPRHRASSPQGQVNRLDTRTRIPTVPTHCDPAYPSIQVSLEML
jgi:hypothetical protein